MLGPGGTADGRSIGIPAAAKTGTANGGYYAAFAGYTPRLAGYVSVFNPESPTGSGAMVYPRANYREVNGALSAPGQMFGDNAPGATWQLTFLSLHLQAKPFVYPPTYPYFDLPLTYTPPKKKHKSPSPTPDADQHAHDDHAVADTHALAFHRTEPGQVPPPISGRAGIPRR